MRNVIYSMDGREQNGSGVPNINALQISIDEF